MIITGDGIITPTYVVLTDSQGNDISGALTATQHVMLVDSQGRDLAPYLSAVQQTQLVTAVILVIAIAIALVFKVLP